MGKKWNNEYFLSRVKDEVGDEYTFLEEYVDSNTPIKVRHNCIDCNFNLYKVSPNQFINGKRRCKPCAIKKQHESITLTESEFLDRINWRTDLDEYTFLSKYEKYNNPIKVRHICGHEYEVTPNNFIRGRSCPKHANNIKREQDTFEKEVFNLVGNDYIFIEEYINTDTPIDIRHNVCGHEYKVAPKEFIHRDARCPLCRHKTTQSFYSKKIEEILNSLNVEFVSEYSISNFSNNKKFDFYIPSKKLLIEFDGMQHFQEKFYIKGKKISYGLLDQIKSDQSKNSFIFNNEENYKLLRIDYSRRKSLEKIIPEFLENSSTTIKKYELLAIKKNVSINYKKYYTRNNSTYFSLIDIDNTLLQIK